MNILILNWRDPKNPFSGGAEKLNLEILRPFVNHGDTVIWYCQAVRGLPAREVFQGIEIQRFGNTFIHLFSWPFFYWTRKFGKIDFIIDSIHGTSYLSSFVAPKTKKIVLICEVAQNIWNEAYPFPISTIGKIWEKIMLKFYMKNKFWTISHATKNDLIRFGIPPTNISILPMGFTAPRLQKQNTKYKNPSALFVGRLAEMKGIKDAIRAIAMCNNDTQKKWSLTIIGRGKEKYEDELKALVVRLQLQKNIKFLGYVSEKKKFDEMSKAWILVVPSSREGWGMIVPESNYVGTPVIGYDSPGLSENLKTYSKENKIVKGTAEAIAAELQKISRPQRIKKNITPGWEKLHRYVLKAYKQIQ